MLSIIFITMYLYLFTTFLFLYQNTYTFLNTCKQQRSEMIYKKIICWIFWATFYVKIISFRGYSLFILHKKVIKNSLSVDAILAQLGIYHAEKSEACWISRIEVSLHRRLKDGGIACCRIVFLKCILLCQTNNILSKSQLTP